MPTEDTGKSKFYFKTEDGEYKELGTGTLEFSSIEAEENNKEWKKLNELYNTKGYTAEIEIQTKKYRRKRFKKLLMSRGVERNLAEIYSRWFNRTQFELDMFF